MLTSVAGQAVPAPLCEKPDELDIPTGALVQEPKPARTIRLAGRCNRCGSRDTVGGICGPKGAGPQVNGPARRAEQEGVAVPILGFNAEGLGTAREPLNAGCERGLARDVPDLVGLLRSEPPRQLPGPIEGDADVVSAPDRFIPSEPTTVAMAVAQCVTVERREAERGLVLGH